MLDELFRQFAAPLLGAVLAGFAAYVGVRVSLSRMAQLLETHAREISLLRRARHNHANRLTQHELRIDTLEKGRR